MKIKKLCPTCRKGTIEIEICDWCKEERWVEDYHGQRLCIYCRRLKETLEKDVEVLLPYAKQRLNIKE
jgi:hypothetical protein